VEKKLAEKRTVANVFLWWGR